MWITTNVCHPIPLSQLVLGASHRPFRVVSQFNVRAICHRAIFYPNLNMYHWTLYTIDANRHSTDILSVYMVLRKHKMYKITDAQWWTMNVSSLKHHFSFSSLGSRLSWLGNRIKMRKNIQFAKEFIFSHCIYFWQQVQIVLKMFGSLNESYYKNIECFGNPFIYSFNKIRFGRHRK